PQPGAPQPGAPQPGAPQPLGTMQPPALALGSILLRRYSIDGYIGGGGFGYIYLASDLALGHRRAIKEAFCRDAYAQHQFRLEAEFLLNARHPNLVRGYAVFEHAGRLYLVMDYVEGHTLEDIAIEHIRRTARALREAQVLDWIIPICDAAQALHSQPVPIIHRDIKPANIKLNATGSMPVLIDLGLAKLYAQGTNTLQAALAFTPGYAPPEQYRASGATDQRTDVYGLGASLYYLLTGYQPLEAPARLSAQALPPPRTLNPLLSAAVEAVVLKAMALDPAERYQTAIELERDLRLARSALDSPAMRSITQPSLANLPAQPATPRDSARAAAEERPRPCPRCGAINAAVARFCMRCGGQLAPEHASARPAVGVGESDVISGMPAPAANGMGYQGPQAQPRGRNARPAPSAARNRGPRYPAAVGVGPLDTGAVGIEWAPLFPHAVASAVRAAERAWPFAASRASMERVVSRALNLGASTPELEAWTSICAVLAVACVSLSLAAAFTRVLLV
ncbi:MAG: protein kinase, partial [Ktedonobacterales bacterium]|nr:protein kinase [Ktedonobacterales bacterium]